MQRQCNAALTQAVAPVPSPAAIKNSADISTMPSLHKMSFPVAISAMLVTAEKPWFWIVVISLARNRPNADTVAVGLAISAARVDSWADMFAMAQAVNWITATPRMGATVN